MGSPIKMTLAPFLRANSAQFLSTLEHKVLKEGNISARFHCYKPAFTSRLSDSLNNIKLLTAADSSKAAVKNGSLSSHSLQASGGQIRSYSTVTVGKLGKPPRSSQSSSGLFANFQPLLLISPYLLRAQRQCRCIGNFCPCTNWGKLRFSGRVTALGPRGYYVPLYFYRNSHSGGGRNRSGDASHFVIGSAAAVSMVAQSSDERKDKKYEIKSDELER